MSLSLTWIICEEISIVINKVFCPPPFAYFVCIKQTLFIGYLSTYFVFGFNLLTLSVFHASVMLLIMNFVITLSKLSANPQLICFLQQQIAVSFVVSNIFTCLSAYWQWLLANERARIIWWKWCLVGTLITLVVVTYSCPPYVFFGKIFTLRQGWIQNFQLIKRSSKKFISTDQGNLVLRDFRPLKRG